MWSTMDKDSMTHTQFPLIPGYGITAHKAQGNNFDISNFFNSDDLSERYISKQTLH